MNKIQIAFLLLVFLIKVVTVNNGKEVGLPKKKSYQGGTAKKGQGFELFRGNSKLSPMTKMAISAITANHLIGPKGTKESGIEVIGKKILKTWEKDLKNKQEINLKKLKTKESKSFKRKLLTDNDVEEYSIPALDNQIRKGAIEQEKNKLKAKLKKKKKDHGAKGETQTDSMLKMLAGKLRDRYIEGVAQVKQQLKKLSFLEQTGNNNHARELPRLSTNFKRKLKQGRYEPNPKYPKFHIFKFKQFSGKHKDGISRFHFKIDQTKRTDDDLAKNFLVKSGSKKTVIAKKIDLFSSEIDSALTDPIHTVPQVVYDKNFEPLGVDKTFAGDKDFGIHHWQDPHALNSTLRKSGPGFPQKMTTIGRIVVGCHKQINQCIQDCRIEQSYNKEVNDIKGVKVTNYFTADQHGIYEKSDWQSYLHNLIKVTDCSKDCLTRPTCIRDINYQHDHFHETCEHLIVMCANKSNCDGYNDFRCMSNCTGDLCYPEYRFIQELRDFKRQIEAKVLEEKIELAAEGDAGNGDDKEYLMKMKEFYDDTKKDVMREAKQTKQELNHIFSKFQVKLILANALKSKKKKHKRLSKKHSNKSLKRKNIDHYINQEKIVNSLNDYVRKNAYSKNTKKKFKNFDKETVVKKPSTNSQHINKLEKLLNNGINEIKQMKSSLPKKHRKHKRLIKDDMKKLVYARAKYELQYIMKSVNEITKIKIKRLQKRFGKKNVSKEKLRKIKKQKHLRINNAIRAYNLIIDNINKGSMKGFSEIEKPNFKLQNEMLDKHRLRRERNWKGYNKYMMYKNVFLEWLQHQPKMNVIMNDDFQNGPGPFPFEDKSQGGDNRQKELAKNISPISFMDSVIPAIYRGSAADMVLKNENFDNGVMKGLGLKEQIQTNNPKSMKALQLKPSNKNHLSAQKSKDESAMKNILGFPAKKILAQKEPQNKLAKNE